MPVLAVTRATASLTSARAPVGARSRLTRKRTAFGSEERKSVRRRLHQVSERTDRPDPPVLPDTTRDEDDAGWGERADERDPDDLQRFLDEKPPHHVD